MAKLFTESEARPVYPQRPLGRFSDFVVERMPQILTAIERGQARDIELFGEMNQAMKQLPYDKFEALVAQPYKIKDNGNVYHSADLAGLDLKMAEAALVTHRHVFPSELGKMVDAVSKATLQPAVLTYEELIYLNPQHDKRLFMAGEIGRTENDFYAGHLHIENGFKKVKTGIEAARVLTQQGSPEIAAEQLQKGNQGMKEAVGLMGEYHRTMSRDNFNIFRQYLGSHPFRNLVGPSGNFTPELPTNEILAYGELLPNEYYDYLNAHNPYFPRRGRAEIAQSKRIKEQGNTLTQLCAEAGKPKPLVDAILETSKLIYAFRNHHFAAVKVNIPDAVENRLKGTAGEDPGTFLVGRRNQNRVRGF